MMVLNACVGRVHDFLLFGVSRQANLELVPRFGDDVYVSLSTRFKFVVRVHRLGDLGGVGLSLGEGLSSVAMFGGQVTY
ncbi:hypothetical protein NL676_010811 [Syzygium grande]|nr:hypothetical protein NL676_010811 [Syzygium grande]